jgi:hypothetical protein
MKAGLSLDGGEGCMKTAFSPMGERRDEGSSDLEEILADGDGP